MIMSDKRLKSLFKRSGSVFGGVDSFCIAVICGEYTKK